MVTNTILFFTFRGDIYNLYRLGNMDDLDSGATGDSATGLSLQSFKFKTLRESEIKCPDCGALKFPKEVLGFCCSNGRIKLDPIKSSLFLTSEI